MGVALGDFIVYGITKITHAEALRRGEYNMMGFAAKGTPHPCPSPREGEGVVFAFVVMFNRNGELD